MLSTPFLYLAEAQGSEVPGRNKGGVENLRTGKEPCTHEAQPLILQSKNAGSSNNLPSITGPLSSHAGRTAQDKEPIGTTEETVLLVTVLISPKQCFFPCTMLPLHA